jgi:hypothetical protein
MMGGKYLIAHPKLIYLPSLGNPLSWFVSVNDVTNQPGSQTKNLESILG